MIDLHTHILPGIDDGVDTPEESLEFARVAVADGTRVIVATPHCKEGFYFNDRETVIAEVDKLRLLLEQEKIDLRLEVGAEVHICPELVERVADGRAPTLADNGKTMLLELSLSQYPVELENLIFELKLAGIEVLLAHPERIRYFQDDIKRYEEAVRMGALGQITTGSVRGTFGNSVRQFSEELLRKGLIHVLASDGHNVRGRHPRMSEALQTIEEWVGPERARAMVESTPQALLEGRTTELPPAPERKVGRTSLFSRIFGRE